MKLLRKSIANVKWNAVLMVKKQKNTSICDSEHLVIHSSVHRFTWIEHAQSEII